MLGPVGDSFLKNIEWRLTIYFVFLYLLFLDKDKEIYLPPEAHNYGLEAKDYEKHNAWQSTQWRSK